MSRLLTDFPMKKKRSDDARHIEGWQSKNERIESLLNVLYDFRFNKMCIRDRVNTLPKEYKDPFAMHVSGFKYREIAEKLNLPLGTVKSRIFFTDVYKRQL